MVYQKWIFCSLLLIFLTFLMSGESLKYTDRPIIGILSQEVFSVQKYLDGNYNSFIGASYVKFVESAGGRVVPIWIGQNRSYYKKVVEKTNGLLLPGGATWFNESGGYGDAGQMLYDAALEINKNGTYYPILGICLGMELLAQVSIGGKEIRDDCSAYKLSLPLEFNENNLIKSKLFREADDKIIDILRSENVTYNSHGYCLTEESFTKYGLNDQWMIISTNKDKGGLEFVSSYESLTYPFYGLQFHPEKNIFEFASNLKIPHSRNAILNSQYFGNFFLDEARKNNNCFKSLKEERDALIYNYNPLYVGKLNSSYEQIYAFKENDLFNNNFQS